MPLMHVAALRQPMLESLSTLQQQRQQLEQMLQIQSCGNHPMQRMSPSWSLKVRLPSRSARLLLLLPQLLQGEPRLRRRTRPPLPRQWKRLLVCGADGAATRELVLAREVQNGERHFAAMRSDAQYCGLHG